VNAIIRLRGYITEEGRLEIELPAQIRPGAVEVTIQPVQDMPSIWTEDEIETLLAPQSLKSGAEIADWLMDTETGWEDVEDGAAWVESRRRKRGKDAEW
jgi:hypothetical protein